MARGWNATVPISHALDALGTEEGSMLTRRNDRWHVLTPPIGHDRWVLGVSNIMLPQWVEPSTVTSLTPTWYIPPPEPENKDIAGIQRVSDGLDFLANSPGDMLVRIGEQWITIDFPFEPNGKVLASNTDNVIGWMNVTDLPWWPY